MTIVEHPRPRKAHMTRLSKLAPWVLGLYVLVMFAVTLAAVGKLSYYGDELVHLQKLQVYLDHGLYAMSGGETESGELKSTRGHLYPYGPIFTLSAHLVAVLFGAEVWGTVSYSDAAFEIRHIMVGVFSLLGVIAAGWGVKLVTRSVTWGLSAAAILVSIPMWTGSAMFNLKDTPIATGFTLFTVGCIALTRLDDQVNRSTRIAGWLAIFGGTLIFWGVRPGIWPAIALGFFAMALIHARFNNFTQWGQTVRSLVFPLSAVVASYVAMVIIYPKVFLNPIVLLYRSFKDTAGFPHLTTVLTDGELLRMPPPWFYIPKWLAAQLPEVLLVLTVVAAVVAVWVVLRRLIRSSPAPTDFAFPALVFIFIQFAAFPAAAVLLKSTIYGGLRQFVFIFPAIAMLVVVALYVIVHTWDARRIRGLWPSVVAVITASTVMTSVIQVQMFPYQSSYFNPTTVAQGIDGRWEVYAWKQAHGELFYQLSETERNRCLRNCPSPEEYPSFFGSAPVVNSDSLNYWEIVKFPNLRRSTKKVQCSGEAAEVSRPYLGGSVSIISASACTISAITFEPIPVTEVDSKKWWKRIAQWGWGAPSKDGVTTIPGIESALAWRVDATEFTQPLVYVMSGGVGAGSADSVTIHATVNGVPLDDVTIATAGSASWEFTVPAPTMPGAPDDLIVVQFVLRDSQGNPVTNPLTVSSIRRGG